MDAMEVAAALRRAAENAGCGLHEVVSGGGDCPEGSCNGCREASAAWANEAADAIERCAMPEGVEWPVVGGRKVDFKTAYAPGLGALEAVSIYNNGACEVMSHDGIIKNVKDIHIARPKVLDADGAEIRVGDTVYGTDGQQYEVTGLSEHEPSIVHARTVGDGVAAVELLALSGQLNSAQLEASNLTHQRPVLDADGVPIVVGRTYYGVSDGAAWLVEGINAKNKSHTIVARNASNATPEPRPGCLPLPPPRLAPHRAPPEAGRARCPG